MCTASMNREKERKKERDKEIERIVHGQHEQRQREREKEREMCTGNMNREGETDRGREKKGEGIETKEAEKIRDRKSDRDRFSAQFFQFEIIHYYFVSPFLYITVTELECITIVRASSLYY